MNTDLIPIDILHGAPLLVDAVSPVPSLRNTPPPYAAQMIGEWVLANFQAPAATTQFITENVDYKHMWGGPYTSYNIIDRAFETQLSPAVRDQLAKELDKTSIYWVPADRRIRYPEDSSGFSSGFDEGFGKPPTAGDAHAEMLARIMAVEQTLTTIDAHHGGMGHNRPPGPIGDFSLPPIDREAIGEALALLKSQPVRPAFSIRPLILRAVGLIKSASHVTGAWLAAKGDMAADEFAKSFGKKAGEMAAYALPGLLSALLAAATKWIGLW
ncbi:hypothetical protein [Bosea sp. (in: a-proteobacteria)]|uniref:hypothetical protein n=1 Tax=Bosea sp. (in: a-proteobacteria) TaxID=1871050 RepID=UPI00273551F7|nr:hypothetical protein [Bosea sp. (in: a-proteobacteria)]MDP3257826.1 hypothetical protein [Bosea sp. (in: a-proteobacteria)]